MSKVEKASSLPRNRVEDNLTAPVMDHLAPSPGRDLRSGEPVNGVLIDVVAARTEVACKYPRGLDQVENIVDVGAFEMWIRRITFSFFVLKRPLLGEWPARHAPSARMRNLESPQKLSASCVSRCR